ncbi:MAG: hypothetical protein ABIL01_11225 [Pseudomonadota bacterium]
MSDPFGLKIAGVMAVGTAAFFVIRHIFFPSAPVTLNCSYLASDFMEVANRAENYGGYRLLQLLKTYRVGEMITVVTGTAMTVESDYRIPELNDPRNPNLQKCVYAFQTSDQDRAFFVTFSRSAQTADVWSEFEELGRLKR